MSNTGKEFIGRYEILSIIGKGAMGEVYKANLHGPAGFRKRVAIKALTTHLGRDSEKHRTDLIQEAQIGGLLQHSNIVNVFELIEEQHKHYIVMELIEGPSVKDLIRQSPVPMRVAIDIVKGSLRGLNHAHHYSAKSGVIHRDIKPSNILISSSGIPKIADFGLAKIQGKDTHEKTGIYGTPFYMSPEAARGEEVDNRSDLFSLGLILYELLTGKRVLEGVSGLAVLLRVQNIDDVIMDAAPMQEWSKSCPELYDFLLRILKADFNLRFNTAAEALAALRAIPLHGPSLEDWLFPIQESGSVASMISEGMDDDSKSDILKLEIPILNKNLIGREKELSLIQAHLKKEGTLICVKGPAGIGKTSLVSECIPLLSKRFDNIWWVPAREMKTLDELGSNLIQIAGAGNNLQHSSYKQAMVDLLSTQERLLLIIDAPEQLIAPLREAIPTWQAANKELNIILSSREKLGIEDEILLDVPSLSPDSALKLLHQITAEKDVDLKDSPILRQVLHFLEGHPLAIQLAAHQLSIHSPEHVLDTLQETSLSQSTTMRDALNLSWKTLSREEQVVLIQLSVCVDGFSISMAERVADTTAFSSGPWILDIISSLIDKSMCHADRSGAETRIRMLHMIRSHAQFHAEPEMLRNAQWRLAKYLAELRIIRSSRIDWSLYYHRLNNERRNMSQSMKDCSEWSPLEPEKEVGWNEFRAQQTLSICSLFLLSGPHPSIPSLVSNILSLDNVSPRTVAMLKRFLGTHYRLVSQYDASIKVLYEGVESLKEHPSAHMKRELYSELIRTYTDIGKYENAEVAFENAMLAAKESESKHQEALALNDYGYHLAQCSRMKEATTVLERAAIILMGIKDWPNVQRTMSNLGLVALRSNDPSTGEHFYRRALHLSHKLRFLGKEDLLWMNLAICSAYQNNIQKAERYFFRALQQAKKKSAHRRMAIIYGNISLLMLIQEKHSMCQKFLGFARILIKRFPHPMTEQLCLLVGSMRALVIQDYSEAYELATQCMQVVREKKFLFKASETLPILIEASAHNGKWTEVSKLMQELRQLPDQKSAINLFASLSAKAHIARIKGDKLASEESVVGLIQLIEKTELGDRPDARFLLDRIKRLSIHSKSG